MNKELIKRLRSHECEGQYASDCCKDVCAEAADALEVADKRIEQLEDASKQLPHWKLAR